VIRLIPDRWQGYARAAKLFRTAQKHDASLIMANMALDRLKEDTNRRVDLTKLKEDILEAQETTEEHNRHVQPHVEKIPVEIMGEVFSLIVAETPENLLVLAQVCQHWRNIISHTSALWGTLVLTYRNPGRKASQWVSRSKGHVRELRVRGMSLGHRDWPPESLRDIAWEGLRVCHVETWDIAKYLKGISMGHILGNLTTLEVDDCMMYPRTIRDSLFLDNSRIQSLTMVNSSFSWNSIASCLDKLSFLSVRDCDVSGKLLPALAANPDLETLLIDIKSFTTPTPQILAQPLSLPKLTRLEFGGAWLPKVLEQLSLPKLRSLNIRQGAGTIDRAIRNITDSKPAELTELYIIQSTIAPSVLIDLLLQTPKLRSLEMSHLTNTANKVVDALATPLTPSQPVSNADGTQPVVHVNLMCPSLTHLNVCNSPDVRTGPLVRLIRSRLPQPDRDNANIILPPLCSKMLSLRADGCDLVDSNWIPWFRSNLESSSCVYMTKKGAAWKR
jgi:F-box/TPR repeat protein Pof3